MHPFRGRSTRRYAELKSCTPRQHGTDTDISKQERKKPSLSTTRTRIVNVHRHTEMVFFFLSSLYMSSKGRTDTGTRSPSLSLLCLTRGATSRDMQLRDVSISDTAIHTYLWVLWVAPRANIT